MKMVWHWTTSIYLPRPHDECACTPWCRSSADNSCSCLWRKLVPVERTGKNKLISPTETGTGNSAFVVGLFSAADQFTFVACTYPSNPAGGIVHLQILYKK